MLNRVGDWVRGCVSGWDSERLVERIGWERVVWEVVYKVEERIGVNLVVGLDGRDYSFTASES